MNEDNDIIGYDFISHHNRFPIRVDGYIHIMAPEFTFKRCLKQAGWIWVHLYSRKIYLGLTLEQISENLPMYYKEII